MRKGIKKLVIGALIGPIFFLIVIPVIIMSAFIPAPESDEAMAKYQEIANLLGVSWSDMLIIDMVENDNDFSKISDREILERALTFMSLEVSELKEERTTVETIKYVKGKPVKIKSTQTAWVVERKYTVGSKAILSFLSRSGRSVQTASDITVGISALDSREDLDVQVNILGFEDVVETLDEGKQEWAWEVYSSNLVVQAYGDENVLPEQILTNYTGFFAWPVPGYGSISSPYGWRIHPKLKIRKFHHGIDIPAPTGTPIIAASSGYVHTVSYSTGSTGFYVKLVHMDQDNKQWSTTYMHMSQISVTKGQTVQPGTVIGAVGSTGRSTGPHLHFEIKYAGNTVDPMMIMQKNRAY